jgi:hypothetical protein
MKDLSYFSGLAKECLQNDKEKMKMYADIDLHRLGQWKPSAALTALPWIQGRNFSSTAPADALDAGARAFATLMPKITIAPLSEEIAEYEDVERKETALDWHFKRMNMWGKKTTHWQILESAMRYCAVAFETEYLPFAFKGQEKDKRTKALLNGSHFRWTVHHPSTVHSRYSKYGLESVCLVKAVNLLEMIDQYGPDNPGILALKEKHFRGKEPTPFEALRTKLTYCKCVDWDETCIFLLNDGGQMSISEATKPGDVFTLLHEEHELSFLPWVAVDNEDPILKNAINTGLLDNLNNLRLISFSSAVALAAASQQLIQTPDGTLRGVKIDNTNPTQPMVTDLSAQVRDLAQPRENAAIENKIASATGEVYATTVAQILADANKLAGTENFSTANMAFKVALGNLSLAKDVAERAEEMGFYQMFQWIDHAGDKPLVAFREQTKTYQEKELPAGQEIAIKKGEFDCSMLYIDVKLREFSSLDEQAKWNLAITQVERLGMSRQIVAEENGIENYSLHEQKRAVEDLMLAKVQAETQKIMAEVQMQVQAAQMQMQMQAQQAQQAAQQPQPQPGQQVADMNASFPVAEGADMRGGSMPAAPSNPMENRESITGMAANGEQLA